jgi:hypothetical protein
MEGSKPIFRRQREASGSARRPETDGLASGRAWNRDCSIFDIDSGRLTFAGYSSNLTPAITIIMGATEDSGGQYSHVVSPFAEAEAMIPAARSPRSRLAWAVGTAIFLIVAGAIGGWLTMRYLNDPLRTLEPFPVAKYLDDYKGLAGSRFKGNLRVEADLGWKDGIGRLMLFTASEDNRPVAVMIPAGVANGTFFEKGQTYLMALEVKEGGLIYANSCTKN